MDWHKESWQDLFKSQNIHAIQEKYHALGAQRAAHKVEIKQIVGDQYGQLLSLAEGIGSLTSLSSRAEKQLSQLSSYSRDAEWKVALENVETYQKLQASVHAQTARHFVSCRLIRLIDKSILQRRFLAAARAVYLAERIADPDPAVVKQLLVKRERLATIMDEWIDSGLNDGMSRDIFYAYLIIKNIPSGELVKVFLDHRQRRIASQLAEHTADSYHQAFDLIESTLFAINQLVDHLFATSLPRSKLIDTPELADKELDLAAVPVGETIASLQAFPPACYTASDVKYDAVVNQFLEGVRSLLGASAEPTLAKLTLPQVEQLYYDLVLRVRDSTELSELADLLVAVFHGPFTERFSAAALAKVDEISGLKLSFGDSASGNALEIPFDVPVDVLIGHLDKAARGQTGLAAEPLATVAAWSQGVAEVKRQIDDLKRVSSLSREESLKTGITQFAEEISTRVNDQIRVVYQQALDKLADLSQCKTASDYALVVTVKRALDRAGPGGSDDTFDAKVYNELARVLVDSWQVEGSDELLQGISVPSKDFNSLLAFVSKMDSVLDNFEWTPLALGIVRPLVLAKLSPSAKVFGAQLMGLDADAVEATASTASKTESAEPKAEAGTETDTETAAQSKTKAETNAEANTEPTAQTETETEPKTESETQTEPETETETEPKTESETQTEPETEPKTETKTEKAEPKAETAKPKAETAKPKAETAELSKLVARTKLILRPLARV